MQARDETTQQPSMPSPAAAAALHQPTGNHGMRTGSFTLRNAVARRAAAFQRKHFSSGPDGGAAGMESEALQKLKQLCSQLTVDDTCVGQLLEVRECSLASAC